MFLYATGITPAMIMRLTDIGSQYLGAFVDSRGEYFDGSKTYKMTLPPNIPAAKFWSLTLYDNQTPSMLQTAQHYPRALAKAILYHPPPKRMPTAPRQFTSAPTSPTVSRTATGSRRSKGKAGTPYSASTARWNHSLLSSGDPLRSNL